MAIIGPVHYPGTLLANANTSSFTFKLELPSDADIIEGARILDEFGSYENVKTMKKILLANAAERVRAPLPKYRTRRYNPVVEQIKLARGGVREPQFDPANFSFHA